MVVEYIRYSVEEDRADAFEQAYRRASDSLDKSEHCERYEVALSRGSGNMSFGSSGIRGRTPVRIPTERGFRSFLDAVGPFVQDIEEMRHYEVRLSSDSMLRPSTRLERCHGGARREEPVKADLGGEPGLLEDLALPPLQPREAERDPRFSRSARSCRRSRSRLRRGRSTPRR